MKTQKVQRSCSNCHHFIEVDGKSACTDIPQAVGKKSYRLLKNTTMCFLDRYWPIQEVQHLFGLSR